MLFFASPVATLTLMSRGQIQQSRTERLGHLGQFCIKHEASKAHAAAVARHKGFMEIKRAGKCDIIHQVTKDAQGHFTDPIERNWTHIKVIIDILFFLCETRIAQKEGRSQGRHRNKEDTESMNRGNFFELFKVLLSV